jgi:iron(III) transport system permease protein
MTTMGVAEGVRGFATRRFSAMGLWHWIVFLTVCAAVVTPLVFLVLGSFSLADLPTEFSLANMGFENYEEVWWDPDTYRVFNNTVIYTTGATAVGITLAAGLAWLVERTNIPGKIWIYAGIPMTLAIPGMLQAMAWVLLLSPRIGFLNRWTQSAFGLA